MHWTIPTLNEAPATPIAKFSFSEEPTWEDDTIYYVYRGKWVVVYGDQLTEEEKRQWYNVYPRERVKVYEDIESVENNTSVVRFYGVNKLTRDFVTSTDGYTYAQTKAAYTPFLPSILGLQGDAGSPTYDYRGRATLYIAIHYDRIMKTVYKDSPSTETAALKAYISNAPAYLEDAIPKSYGNPVVWSHADLVDILQFRFEVGDTTRPEFMGLLQSIINAREQKIFYTGHGKVNHRIPDLTTTVLETQYPGVEVLCRGVAFSDTEVHQLELLAKEPQHESSISLFMAGDIVSTRFDSTRRDVITAVETNAVHFEMDTCRPSILVMAEGPVTGRLDIPPDSHELPELPIFSIAKSTVVEIPISIIVAFRDYEGELLYCLKQYRGYQWISASLLSAPVAVDIELPPPAKKVVPKTVAKMPTWHIAVAVVGIAGAVVLFNE